MARVGLTQKHLKTDEGRELLEMLMEFTRDGVIDEHEINKLEDWLEDHWESEIPAVTFLRDVLETAESRDLTDCWNVLLAIERVVPPDQRALVKMRRSKTPQPATPRQVEFLSNLGVDYGSELSKNEASDLIDKLKEEDRAEAEYLREQERESRQDIAREQSERKKAKVKKAGCLNSGCLALIVLFAILMVIGYFSDR